MYKAILFDLDGTLLPMDQNNFINAYFTALHKRVAACGYELKELVKAVWQSTNAMVKNDGSRRNEQVFWQAFADTVGERAYRDKPEFDAFYENEFYGLKANCGFNAQAAEAVNAVTAAGRIAVLATNPVFPMTAQLARLSFAGVSADKFAHITSYENSGFCKPNPLYFDEIARRIGVPAPDCLMVGNDVSEDGGALKIGMDVFFVTDCLINKSNTDISEIPHGDFGQLLGFLKKNGTL